LLKFAIFLVKIIDFIVIDSVANFTDALDKEFQEWEEKEINKEGKV